MIRLLLVLCAAIFITLQIGGENAGAKPLGLVKHVAPQNGTEPLADAPTSRDPLQLAQAAPAPQTIQPQGQAQLINASMSNDPAAPPPRAMTRPLTRPSLDRLSAQANPLGTTLSDGELADGERSNADQNTALAGAEMPQGATQPGTQDVYFVKGRGVNVRAAPTASSEVVGKLGRGEAVTVVWFDPNGWARIRIEGDGIEGYMSQNYLATRD